MIGIIKYFTLFIGFKYIFTSVFYYYYSIFVSSVMAIELYGDFKIYGMIIALILTFALAKLENDYEVVEIDKMPLRKKIFILVLIIATIGVALYIINKKKEENILLIESKES